MRYHKWYKYKRGSINRQHRGTRCYECGKPGHIKRYCPLLNRKTRKNKTSGKKIAQEFIEDYNSTTRPRVSV